MAMTTANNRVNKVGVQTNGQSRVENYTTEKLKLHELT